MDEGDATMTTTAEDPQDATAAELTWAHELFDGARGEAEPAWAADLPVIKKGGYRRRRVRRAQAGGGLLAVLAVTAAAAVTLGAGTTDYGSIVGPGQGWGGRPLQDVFKYVEVSGGSFQGNGADLYDHVPKSAAVDLAALVGHLDPGFRHLTGLSSAPGDAQPGIVGDGDPWLKGASVLLMSSHWTADGSPTGRIPGRSARLAYEFIDDLNLLHAGPPFGETSPPCGLTVDQYFNYSPPDTKTPAPKWSPCQFTELPDGSRVGTTSAAFGAGTETVAVRIFASGNVVAMVGENYPAPGAAAGGLPPAGTVVTPSPWTQDGLRAALSDPAVGPVLKPAPPVNADGKMLVPSDVGSDWAYDRAASSQESTGEFVMDNGCNPDHSIFGLAAGRAVSYNGSLPDGTAVTGFEGEYRLPAGTGARTMQDARTYGQGGCDPAPGGGFSQDTVTALPSGIGDDAFVQNQPQQGTVRVTVRIGDTILQTDIVRADHARLALASDADRAWLRRIAVGMAARYTGTAKHG